MLLMEAIKRLNSGVVCLANLASHVIICDLIRLGVMCLQGDGSTSPGSTAHRMEATQL